ncbi:hypothetical protein DAERI_160113 [Deinococcus aerius]|uniref:Uncharacterized protein n=1 Tax=Deinococcus aerius TaxID=200253 RepID=A0A2I9E200_9DEIO|nr:hypothetical protein [Deinococcus aerius]GBF07735.1 hypothetical protein DAERI_160113 [Deinococcus aerius]
MLTVHLHLCNGDVITIPMTRSQRDRLGRTLNQAVLPVTPFEATVDGADLSIPWRSIAYLSSPAQPKTELLSGQAAD